MKTPSTLLFDLLQSLSGAELRYVKVQLGQVDSGYVRLMNAVLSQKSYDEAALKKEYAAESFVQNLSVNKRYLIDLVLRMLGRFGQNEQREKILKHLRFARILFQRQFLIPAKKELQKAKRLAEKLDAYEELLLIYSLEKQLLTAERYEIAAVHVLHKAINKTLGQIQNINDYWFLYTRLYQLQMQKRDAVEVAELRSLAESDLFQQDEHATTIRSKMYRFQAQASYYFSTRQAVKAHKANLSFLQLLEINPVYLKYFSEAYLSTLNHYLIDCMMLEQYDALDEGLLKLERAEEDPAFAKIKNLPARIFRQKMMLLLNRAMLTRQFKEGSQLLPELQRGLKQFGLQIQQQHKISLQYLAAYLLFKNKEYDDAINWTNTLLQNTKEAILSELFHYTRWINLLAHFELRNYTLVQSLLQQTKRYIRQRRKIKKTEMLLYRNLKKACRSPGQRSIRKQIKGLAEPLEGLRKEEPDFFQYLDLTDWVGSYR